MGSASISYKSRLIYQLFLLFISSVPQVSFKPLVTATSHALSQFDKQSFNLLSPLGESSPVTIRILCGIV